MTSNIRKVFFGESVIKSHSVRPILLTQFVDMIKGNNQEGNTTLNVINKIRSEMTDKDAIAEIKKKNLPYVVFNCIKKDQEENYIRKTDNLEYADVIILDYDNIPINEVEEVKKRITQDSEVYICFITPSGKGLRVLLLLEKKISDLQEFRKIYSLIANAKDNLYRLQHDKACSDPLRTSYISYDPDIYYNTKPSLVKVESLPAEEKNDRKSKVKKPSNEKTNSREVVKEPEYSNSEIEDVIDFLTVEVADYNIWMRICFALCNHPNGKDLFIKLTINNTKYNDSADFAEEVFDKALMSHESRDDSERVHLNTLYYIAYKLGYRNFKFYQLIFDNDNIYKGVYLNHSQILTKLLPSMGFFRFKEDFIQIKNYIICNSNVIEMKEAILNYVRKEVNEDNKVKIDLEEKLIRSTKSIFTRDFLEYLPMFSGEFVKDTDTQTYMFFKNGYIVITKNWDEKVYDYSSINAYIFQNQIFNVDFSYNKELGDFDKFIANISLKKEGITWVKNEDKQDKLMTIIGYLINNYKKKSLAKAVILLDEVSEDNLDFDSRGGTGKSLISQALGYARKTKLLDGKQFKTDSQFMLQSVHEDDNIIIIDDVFNNFNFESLFSCITGDMTIERKNMSPILLKFCNSPKFLITSNKIINSTGISAERRKIEFYVNHYYDETHQPINDFGKEFFNDWDDQEWNKFFNFLAECVAMYHYYGIIDYHESSHLSELISKTCSSFVSFANEFIDLDEDYLKDNLYEQFIERNPIFRKYLSKHKFTKWLNEFAKLSKINVIHTKSNGNSYVCFFNNDPQIHSKKEPENSVKISEFD